MSTLRRGFFAFLAGGVAAAWIGCGEVVPNTAAETPTPDGTASDGAPPTNVDGPDGDGGGGLSVAWHKEVRMNDTAAMDASSSVGGYVAARGEGVEFLVTAKGEYAGTVTNSDDPMLLTVSPDGGTANVQLVGGGAGSQYGRFVMTTSQNHLFVATLDSAVAPWASRIRRIDNFAAGPNADLVNGGLINVWALAPWAAGFFYAGASTPSGAPGAPSRALYGAVGTSGGRVDDGTLAEARTVAALPDGVAFGGHFTGGIGAGACAATSSDGGAIKAGFVIRLNADRSCRWGHVFRADGAVTVEAVAADGYVIAAGTFSGTFADNGMRANDGVFVARLDASTGAIQWVKTFSSVGATTPRAVRVDYAGRVVVTGSLGSRLDFGRGEMIADGQNNVFVATFANGGELQDSLRFGSGRVESFGLAVGPTNRLYVSGTIYSGTLGLPGSGAASDRWRTFLVALDRN